MVLRKKFVMNIFLKGLLLSLFFFQFNNLYSQIYYTDYSPNKVLQNTAYDSTDFNLDGVYDIKFTQEDSIQMSSGANGIGITLMHYDIEFVGLAPSYDASHFYTFKLDSNIYIDNNAAGQLWVTKLGPSDAVRIMQMFFYNVPYHLGEWVGGVVDAYLGIRLKIDGDWHYGWIKMDVDVDAHMLTIKGFAYNTIANQGIYTGQKTSYKHNNIEVSYELANCGNVISYDRSVIPNHNYDIVCRSNINGQMDSIGFINNSSSPIFIDEDTVVVLGINKYNIIPITTDNMYGVSDTVASLHASLYIDANANTILNWSPYKNLDFTSYYIQKLDTSTGSYYVFDSVPNTINTYTVATQYIDLFDNNYMVSVTPNQYITNGVSIKSNYANLNPNTQIHPIAGFTSEYISSNNIHDYQFWDKSGSNIKNWLWDFGDGNYSIKKNPQHSFSQGVWTVSLRVTNCYGIDSIAVLDHIIINNIEKSVSNSISVFPNPSKGIINIKNNGNLASLKIYSAEGKLMKSYENISATKSKFDISELDNGLYFLDIFLRNNDRITKKFIIIKY